MIPKFKDYIKLNESVSTASLSQVLKELTPYGWEYYHKKNGDGVVFFKDDFKVGGNLKHNASRDENRYIDINTLDQIRSKIIADFEVTNDPSNINAIDWNSWDLKNPFTKELKEYDSISGQKKSDIEMFSKITLVEQLFKNVWVIKNENGEYNLCKSDKDKRPLLDKWYPLYMASKMLKGKMCLGYDYDPEDDPESWGTYLYEIKEDGTLGQTFSVDCVKESVKK